MKLKCTGKLTGESVEMDWGNEQFQQNLTFLSRILQSNPESVELRLLRGDVIETHCYIYRRLA